MSARTAERDTVIFFFAVGKLNLLFINLRTSRLEASKNSSLARGVEEIENGTEGAKLYGPRPGRRAVIEARHFKGMGTKGVMLPWPDSPVVVARPTPNALGTGTGKDTQTRHGLPPSVQDNMTPVVKALSDGTSYTGRALEQKVQTETAEIGDEVRVSSVYRTCLVA